MPVIWNLMSPKKAESGGRPLAGHYPQPGGCRVVKSYVVSTSIPSDPGRHRPPERPAPRRCTPAGCQRSLPATGAWTPSHDPPAGGPPQIPASEAPADPAGPPGSPRWAFPGRRRAGCPWRRRGRCPHAENGSRPAEHLQYHGQFVFQQFHGALPPSISEKAAKRPPFVRMVCGCGSLRRDHIVIDRLAPGQQSDLGVGAGGGEDL